MAHAESMLTKTRAVAPKLLLGWREWLNLPSLGLPTIRAKVDSGARSSALHVDTLEVVRREDREFALFSLDPDNAGAPVRCEAEIIGRRPVTDSGGHTSERIFIRTELQLATQRFLIEVNLTSRRNMLFPMLLGRTAMEGRCLVDPAASFLLGEPSPPNLTKHPHIEPPL